ncbi:inositol monophosphatase family protein [Ornithinicoccus halotolerans]|uniref:inositol monophosphatase family protein n=1 Tax=Ornithinicoccus halotolerans TaxID=1748220 RepID=UPI001297DAE7|nr:inositol monophosphatase [Ornithinicoccus halotolerans]
MDTQAVLELMQEVAAGVINPRFRSLDEADVTEKKPGDLVTVADHEAEEWLTRELSRAYPGAVVLGEEEFERDPGLIDRFAQAEHAFTVDPVDGTKNFVRGSPDHAVMVAEVRLGVTVRGWIWQPQHQLGYVAEQGAGAYRNGERLRRAPAAEDVDRLRGVTATRSRVGHRYGPLRPLGLSWVCCGVDYPRLVEERADFVLYGSVRPWDHAPGSLLVTEAGGYSAPLAGPAYRPGSRPGDLLVAADPRTHQRVAPHLRQQQ